MVERGANGRIQRRSERTLAMVVEFISRGAETVVPARQGRHAGARELTTYPAWLVSVADEAGLVVSRLVRQALRPQSLSLLKATGLQLS